MVSATAQLPVPTPESDPAPRFGGDRPEIRRAAGGVALALAPAAVTLYLAFRGGGYHAETYASVLALLAVVLGVRTVTSANPFAGLSGPLGVACASLGLLVIWAWLSSAWSDTPWRALFDSQRTALYLVALVLFGAFARRRGGAQLAITGLAGAIVVVCFATLLAKLFPSAFPVSSPYGPQRLSFPLGYWNSLGLLAAIGVVLLVHLASDLNTRPIIRSLAAAATPAVAATIYFTFSRGATGAVVLGVAAYVLIGRPRGLPSAALAIVPATAFALNRAYDAWLLGTYQAANPMAAGQRHQIAIVLVLACAAAGVIRHLLIRLDRRLDLLPSPSPQLGRQVLIGAVAALLLAVVVAVAADLPGRAQDAYHSFTRPENSGDARTRFEQVTLSGRQAHWDVAISYFRDHPVRGEGAGMFETQWLRSRSNPATAAHAHSLYLETLGELGLVGFTLLLAALVALLGGLLARARGARRPMYAALFAAFLMWAVHSGVDYDWELPAVGLGLFAVIGLALAEPGGRERRFDRIARTWPFRLVAAAACVFVCVTAVRTVIADTAINRANDDISNHVGCSVARAEARTSLSAVPSLAEPYEILGMCDLFKGHYAAATTSLRRAISRDPTQWQYRWDLAIARAAVRRDPRPDLRIARRLNPHAQTFTSGVGVHLDRPLGPAGWRRIVSVVTWPPY